MVGFVQQYSEGTQFIPPQNQQFVQEYMEEFMYVESEAKEKQQSMKNHKIVCFYGEQVSGKEVVHQKALLADQKAAEKIQQKLKKEKKAVEQRSL